MGIQNSLMAVMARKNAAGGGVTLSIQEEFEGPGYQLTWVETDTNAIINDQSTTTVPTGGGTYSWFLDGSGNTGEPDTFAYYNNGSEIGAPHYGRAYMRLVTGTPVNDEFWFHVGNSTTFLGLQAYNFSFGNTSGTATITATARLGSAQTFSASFDTWYRVEWKYDNTTGVLDWRVDSVDQTSSTGGSTGRASIIVQAGTSELGEAYIDRIAFSTEDWIGTQ
jgi:hypothetical protein